MHSFVKFYNAGVEAGHHTTSAGRMNAILLNCLQPSASNLQTCPAATSTVHSNLISMRDI
jgi:hypothetical protein